MHPIPLCPLWGAPSLYPRREVQLPAGHRSQGHPRVPEVQRGEPLGCRAPPPHSTTTPGSTWIITSVRGWGTPAGEPLSPEPAAATGKDLAGPQGATSVEIPLNKQQIIDGTDKSHGGRGQFPPTPPRFGPSRGAGGTPGTEVFCSTFWQDFFWLLGGEILRFLFSPLRGGHRKIGRLKNSLNPHSSAESSFPGTNSPKKTPPPPIPAAFLVASKIPKTSQKQKP